MNQKIRPYNLVNYSLAPPGPPPGKTKHKARRALLLGGVMLIAILGLKVDLSQKAHARAVEAAETARQAHARADLGAVVGQIIKQNPQIDFSVSLVDIDSGQTQNFGNLAAIDAASTAKIISAAVYYHNVELGRDSLATLLGDRSAATRLRLMVNQSDDTSWELINNHLGHAELKSFAQRLGLNSYNPETNQISAADMAKFMQKLYEGKILSTGHTHQLLSYMRDTNYEDFITPAVPAGDFSYHKVGINEDNVNDVAIITNTTDSFALAIYTNGHGFYNWQGRAALMQQVARAAISAYLSPKL